MITCNWHTQQIHTHTHTQNAALIEPKFIFNKNNFYYFCLIGCFCVFFFYCCFWLFAFPHRSMYLDVYHCRRFIFLSSHTHTRTKWKKAQFTDHRSMLRSHTQQVPLTFIHLNPKSKNKQQPENEEEEEEDRQRKKMRLHFFRAENIWTFLCLNDLIYRLFMAMPNGYQRTWSKTCVIFAFGRSKVNKVVGQFREMLFCMRNHFFFFFLRRNFNAKCGVGVIRCDKCTTNQDLFI